MNHVNTVLLVLTVTGIGRCEVPQPECSSGKCTCEVGYVVNSKNTSCLPYVTEYFGDCSEDGQCAWLGENSECRYVCRCKTGYYWYSGRCNKYVGLGEACSPSLDCFDGYNFEALTCEDGRCVCSDGYYQRGDTDCRKKATDLNATCALDVDCQVLDTKTVCHLGKCKPSDNSREQTTYETEEVTFSATALTLAKQCHSNDDCTDMENSECYNNTKTCVCKPSYFLSDDGTECVAELGVNVTCTSDESCKIKPGKCVDGVCYCRDYYFVQEGNQKCVKTISEHNWNCLSREWCYALGPYGYCNSNGTCACSKISDFDPENLLCKRNNEIEDPNMCKSDVDCRGENYAICINEECVILLDPELGQKCSDMSKPCKQENSDCLNGICQCVQGYVEADKLCYTIMGNIGDSCENSIQCDAGVTYSECLNGKCFCKKDRIANNNTCFPIREFGSYCNNRLECSVSLDSDFGGSIQCRNHKCQCPTGYTKKEGECTSGTILARSCILTVILTVYFQSLLFYKDDIL